MKMNELGRTFSKKYFMFTKKIRESFEKNIVNKNLEKEISQFYKKYGVAPRETEIEQIKKEIVMKQGLSIFVVFLLIFYVSVLLLKGV